MTSVLVTGGLERSALAVARSLAREGHEVHVCSTRRRCLAGASRFVRSERRVPAALDDPSGFASAVAALCRELEIDVLLPTTDPDVLATVRERERFGDVVLPLPDADAFEAISDKSRLTEVARPLGIETPGQVRICSEGKDDLAEAAELGFPVVVKPARSVVEEEGRYRQTSVSYASDEGELRSIVDGLPGGAFPILLQRKVTGPGVGVFLLIWDGELLASFAHRRIREKPPSGGVSVLRESIPLSAELRDRSLRLLEAFGWRGVAMVEYKEEPSGRMVLMEVNGRFWGSLQLAIDAGVDFPSLLVDAALGRPVQPVLDYRPGVRLRWLWGDADHLIARFRRSRKALDLPPNAPGRWGAVLDFLRSFSPGTRSEVFRLSDPGPALRETLDWVARR